MHLHIIMRDMIIFDIDIVSSDFLEMLILIYIYMYYILPKLCQYAPLFQYFGIFIKHICI